MNNVISTLWQHSHDSVTGLGACVCRISNFNEIGRRTKIGGIVLFVIIPAILTIYFIAIQAGLFGGHSNQTYEYMNGWFHYAKLYAADIGVVGFS